jgi:hypothetical protein
MTICMVDGTSRCNFLAAEQRRIMPANYNAAPRNNNISIMLHNGMSICFGHWWWHLLWPILRKTCARLVRVSPSPLDLQVYYIYFLVLGYKISQQDPKWRRGLKMPKLNSYPHSRMSAGWREACKMHMPTHYEKTTKRSCESYHLQVPNEKDSNEKSGKGERENTKIFHIHFKDLLLINPLPLPLPGISRTDVHS